MEFMKTHRHELETDYPYYATDGSCNYGAHDGKVGVWTIANVGPYSSDNLKAAIAEGPTAVTVEADSSVF